MNALAAAQLRLGVLEQINVVFVVLHVSWIVVVKFTICFNYCPGNITLQTMIDVLRAKDSMDQDSFLITGSMVSVIPQSSNKPCIHFFTATPDPARFVPRYPIK